MLCNKSFFAIQFCSKYLNMLTLFSLYVPLLLLLLEDSVISVEERMYNPNNPN
jgi:hypothetical protein